VDTPKGAKMRQECSMAKRKRRRFSPEFKADAVKLVQTSGRSVPDVARELDLTETALREWVKRSDIDAGKGPAGALTSAEREELVALRRETKRLRMERDILKAAATFFAKESE
jgi:transposase